ncbi:MAG: tRNA lysidine(34) synthetase TilS [Caldimonas sp.]
MANATSLDIASWRALSRPRQSHALRAWLRETSGAPPSASLVARLLGEVGVVGARRWPAADCELRAYRGRLRWHPSLPAATEPAPMAIDLSRPGLHELATWGGAIRVERVESGGLPVGVAARLELRARVASDRFQAGPGRPPRSLKLQFQAAAVPTWQRDGPIVCHGGTLVFVPGLGIDARAVSAEGEAQVALAWQRAG